MNNSNSQNENQDEETFQFIFKLILIGNSGTGKTSIINRYINEKFEDSYKCTIGVDFILKKIKINNQNIKLQIWDTAGMEKYKQITTSYYRGAHGAIVVFDLTNKDSFNDVQKWVNDFYNITNQSSNMRSVVIVGNKSDLIEKREVNKDDIDKYISINNLSYVETSAKDGLNIEKMFVGITEELMGKYKDVIGKKGIGTFSQGENIKFSDSLPLDFDKKKKGCCE